jgi:hypothetical protein
MRLKGILIGSAAAAFCAATALAAAPRPARPNAKPAAAARPPLNAQPFTPRAGGSTPNASPEAIEFFEKEVRPVLAEHCYTCHGEKLAQSGLRVDSLAALLRGMDGGRPALVKGDPHKSPLIQVVRFDGKVKMPPQGKLPDKAIAALEAWVKMGAPWPSDEGAQRSTLNAQRPHWAFQPVRKPAIPAVKTRGWVKTPIDALVLSRLEAKGLSPSPPADRRTLMRRAYYDLTGLPPTAEEVEAFVRDRSPDAWAKVVDRLLASPHFGERWARHWMDISRYADTKGYVFQEERRYPFAYTYRDWLIRAFNEDLPYDQFLIQQIAADHLELNGDKRPLAAMGFLTLGRRFLNNQADIIDDRLDVVFRGTQALAVGCARCHDHKFDPIPIKDYYSLYGVFASSTEPGDLPLLAEPERTAEYLAFEKQLKALEAEVDKFRNEKGREALARARERIPASMMAADEAEKKGGETRGLAVKYEISSFLIERWQKFFAETKKNHHPLFAPWHAFAAIPEAEFAAKAPELAARLAKNDDPQRLLHPRVAELFAAPPASLQELADRYGKLLSEPGGDQQLRHALDSIGGPLNIEPGQYEQLFNRAERDRIRALRQKVDAFRATSPAAPPRAMVLVDSERPVTPRVFLRGNPRNRGEEVPRQFLAVLSGPERKPFQKGSGRLELAQAIASRENPLTARVMVNRIWGWVFGKPLVGTPSDFGTRSDPPTNPELLDWMASYFSEGAGESGVRLASLTPNAQRPTTGAGWSVKAMLRMIMLSSTYQQSSDYNAKSARVDPENTLVWRMNRRRLDFEQTRDTLLAAAGRLDRNVGGPSVDIFKAPFTTRRTVYAFIDRQNLPNTFRTFDFAIPDTHSPLRFQTTVPQQALYMLNSPFAVEQAKALVARPEVTGAPDDAAKIRQLYRLVYARDPAPDEIALATRYLAATPDGPRPNAQGPTPPNAQGPTPNPQRLTPWERYAQALLMSNELMFID